MPEPLTPAEEFRDAERILRERAQWATPPPWDYDRFEEDGPWAVVWDGPQGDPAMGMVVVAEAGRDWCGEQNARWVAAMHPGIAEPLAAAFDAAANDADQITSDVPAALIPSVVAVRWWQPLLAVARVIRAQHQTMRGGESS